MKRALYVLAIGVLLTSGCGKSGTEDVKPSDPAAWTPDPALTPQLTQAGNAGKYAVSLPQEFRSVPLPKMLPSLKGFAWTGPVRGNEPPAMLSITVLADPKAVQEARQNMRQFLVNFSAGVADGFGINIVRRAPTETGSLAGLAFSRFRWTGTVKGSQTPALGFAYGAIDDGSVVAITALNCGGDAEAANKLMETIIATFKTQ